MAKTSYAIALGSNRRSRHGSPAQTLRAALAGLDGVQAVSTIRATPALGPAGRGFANAVAIVESRLAPDALLAELKAMERAFGRRPGRRWGPRVLDLDIILWSGGAWGGPGPIVPHPEYRKRAFVLQPLAEIAPAWRDPLTGATIRQLLARLTAPRPAPRSDDGQGP
ncbi:MAG: 2-amino-4-hydroxy-6-hydroxymethyldihydropteridine diphosphokinase [Sphingomonadales bacterium]|jgi:2-amino-4-hydroxy-6-hydroxymethyldihydropteridine diphosphokinase|nr:2-amino-4-hydroxy-6-hydroxymethyldihydropteridine diphosphokinase [Sphingomonadales bacterium]